MKIISLLSENVKKISVVEIRPDGNLVQITGKNGQGKTSVLDSIWWALAGSKNVQSAPIRKGATEARIRLDLGDIIVTRTFAEGKDGPTTKIVVETTEGYRASKPQKILDDLLGSLSFDPLQFTRLDPKKQFDELRQFVPDVDFDQIEIDNKRDFERRTDINRQAKQCRAAADAIDVPVGLPDAPIDESALVSELEQAGRHNAELELRAERRRQAAEQLEHLLAAPAAIEADYDARASRVEADANARIQAINAEIERLQNQQTEIAARCSIELAELRASKQSNLAVEKQKADELTAKLQSADELPPLISTAALRDQIEAARRANAGIARRTERAAHLIRAEQLEAAAKDLTDAMERRVAAKEAAIAAAELPVPGLSFGDGAILLNGLPFDQASDAEQLRASVAIAMASSPKLRVIRVRDGSLLDEEGVRILGEMADQYDCQVWLEKVDSSGKVGFVLEDGHLKAQPPRRPEQASLLGAAE